MARYSMQDGSVVETGSAEASWPEHLCWTFSSNVSKATGSEADHETLYRSNQGRYYVEHTSEWQDSTPYAEWISPELAAEWLRTNDYDEDSFPQDLRQYAGQVLA